MVVILNVNNFRDDTLIQDFRFSGVTLVYENYTSNIDGNVIVNAKYKKLMTIQKHLLFL